MTITSFGEERVKAGAECAAEVHNAIDATPAAFGALQRDGESAF